ncbi:MAG TPA: hypothetical protein DEB40_06515 [Elusimicrobia bacterium]|nr:hypothetical protein [Elusimicrobiota bacterium]HBT61380.1 hypothetical protein [Elusimicrobiota bacterium]
MDTPPANQAPKTWSFSLTFSWDGPGLPSRAQAAEFFRSLSRRDLAIVAGSLLFIFIIEPLLLFWIFSARLRGQLHAQASTLASSLSSQIQNEVGPAVREALHERHDRVVTPLNAPDPTSLVISPAAAPPPPSGRPKP